MTGTDDPDRVLACAVACMVWRNSTAEHIDDTADGSMAYMNIAATAAVEPFCSTQGVNWHGVVSTLLDPDRVVLPGRTARDVLGDKWIDFTKSIQENAQPGDAGLAFSGLLAHGWWGMPDYDPRVERLVERHMPPSWTGTSDELRSALLDDPLSVPLAVWDEIVVGNGLGWTGEREAMKETT